MATYLRSLSLGEEDVVDLDALTPGDRQRSRTFRALIVGTAVLLCLEEGGLPGRRPAGDRQVVGVSFGAKTLELLRLLEKRTRSSSGLLTCRALRSERVKEIAAGVLVMEDGARKELEDLLLQRLEAESKRMDAEEEDELKSA